jgi:hypothetical protein
MLENLLETWSKLAPDELELDKFGCCSLAKTREWHWIYPCGIVFEYIVYQEKKDIDTLQGYLQQCIEARKWGYEIRGLSGYLNGRLVDGVAEYSYCASIQGPLVQCSEKETIVEALLTCYLEMLSYQRAITQGHWKHADGDIYWVTDAHEWSGHGFYSFLNEDWSYSLEEHPNIKIQMSSSNYNASQDYGDRVFYDGDSGKWARLKYSFLGLKDDGRLRFEKVDD